MMPAREGDDAMTKRHLMTLRLVLLLGDAVVAWLVFLVVSRLRFDVDPTAHWSVGIEIGAAAVLFAVMWVAVLWAMGLYRIGVRWSLLGEARDLAKATVVALALTLSMLFLTHQDNVSRVFLAALFVAQPAVTLAGRGLLRLWFDVLRRRGLNTNYMIVVGVGRLAQEFADRVEAHRGLGLRVIGHLTVPANRRGSARARGNGNGAESEVTAVSRPVLGTVDDLADIFRARTIDEVAICLPPAAANLLDPIVSIAAEEGKTVRVPSDPDEELLGHALVEDFDGLVVRSVVHDSHRDFELALKRIIDIVGAAVGLIVLSPILIATAIAIRLRDGSPVLFRQVRVGRHGRPFTIYKFRTMRPDAEEQFSQVAASSDTKGAAFKMRDDPRVTPLGRFLRSASLDELPQLINVLKGDMSLVGPRPAPPREVDQYDMWHRRRLSMRPGMTGLWQVTARMDDHFDDRAQLDLKYIDGWTFWTDVSILARTVPALLMARGR
jgi:exopolysaccharide biosynthesis polyprenyl glycosylphosphotransferase